MWLTSTAGVDGTRINAQYIAFNCMGQAQATVAEHVVRACLGVWAGRGVHLHADRHFIENSHRHKPFIGPHNCHLQEEMQREAQAIVGGAQRAGNQRPHHRKQTGGRVCLGRRTAAGRPARPARLQQGMRRSQVLLVLLIEMIHDATQPCLLLQLV